MVDLHPEQKKNLDALRRIEGQIRGIQKMIEEKRYCVDILTQLRAVSNAVSRVEEGILKNHLDTCFKKSLTGRSTADKEHKIEEVIYLLKNFRKAG